MASRSCDRFDHAVTAAYDAVLRPCGWQEALVAAAELVGGASGVLALRNGASTVPVNFFGYDPAYINSITSYYMPLNPLLSVYQTASVGKVGANSRVVSREAFRRSVFYNEWALPQGLCDSIFCVVDRRASGTSTLSITRRRASGEATDTQLARMSQLAPHLVRAVRLGGHLRSAIAEIAARDDAFHNLPFALMLLREDGSIALANSEAESMLAKGGALLLRGRRLVARQPNEADALSAALGACCTRTSYGLASSGQGTDLVLRDAEGQPLMITIAPVSRRISSEVTGAERIAAVVLAIRPADASRGSITASRLFDLTRMEARVLAALQEHPGLPGVALRLGIARSTARTHLQSIFGKTGARNQAELLRLVTSLGVARGR